MKPLNVDLAPTSGHAVHTQRPRYLPLSETKYAHLIGKPMTEGQAALVVYGPELQAERDRLKSINADLLAALEGLMALESRGRVMPFGKEWDDARAAIAKART